MQRKRLYEISKKCIAFLSAACLTAASLSGCGNESGGEAPKVSGNVEENQAGGQSAGDSTGTGEQNGTGGSTGTGEQNSAGDSGTEGSGTEADGNRPDASVSETVQNAGPENVLAVEEMFTDRDLKGDYKESEGVAIALSGGSARCDSKDVSISEGSVIIKAEGTYILSGALENGLIIVEADDAAKVQLVLKGVSISNSDNAAIYVRSADKVFVTLAQGTVNTLANGGSYAVLDDNNIDAVIFAKCDLTVNGTGSLEVSAKAGHGIVSKDDLKIMDGDLTITAEKHGLSGKNSVRIAGGAVNIVSGKDGIHADHDSEDKGYVYIAGGTFSIDASGDGVSASGQLQLDGGSFDITAGKGSANRNVAKDSDGAAVSAKGIKAAGNLVINDGSYVIDSQDDALHSNGDLTVNGGDYRIATGDDGLHGDGTTAVAGGRLIITTSYEGIEGKDVAISGGYIDLYASDDGINAAGGKDQSGFGGMFGGFGGGFGGGAGQGGDYSILISGGTLYVNAYGDGLDSNGTLTVTGGTIYIDGPASSADGALDYDGTGEITGGTIIALGASGMAQNFTEASNQGSILLNTGNQKAGTAVSLKDADGRVLLNYTSKKAFGSVVVSCPELIQGGVYTLSVGDSDTEITMDSLIYGNGMGGFGGGHGGMGGFGGGRGDSRKPGGNMPGQPGAGDVPELPEGMPPGAGDMPELPEGMQPGAGDVPEPPDGMPPGTGGAQNDQYL